MKVAPVVSFMLMISQMLYTRKDQTCFRWSMDMNIIQIVSDTFRRDYLGCYGNDWIHTENLDALADESVVFDKAYVASFPTIPHRTDIFTGKYTFTRAGWQPLPKDEAILAQLLRQSGYTTMLIGTRPIHD